MDRLLHEHRLHRTGEFIRVFDLIWRVILIKQKQLCWNVVFYLINLIRPEKDVKRFVFHDYLHLFEAIITQIPNIPNLLCLFGFYTTKLKQMQ